LRKLPAYFKYDSTQNRAYSFQYMGNGLAV